MLHLDGSVHEWFTLAPAARPCLIVVSDDATKRVFHAAFYPSESTWSVRTSLAAVLRTEGLPMALYTDRAHWAFHTPNRQGTGRQDAAHASGPGPDAIGAGQCEVAEWGQGVLQSAHLGR